MDTYSVYVIQLDEAVWADRRFRKDNPGRNRSCPCAYVGMTGRSVEFRFQQHRDGYKANRYARDHGVRLIAELCVRGLGREQAAAEEMRIATRLRAAGWGIWQA